MGKKKKKKKGEQDNEKISVKCVSGNKLLTLLQVGQSKSQIYQCALTHC